MTDSPSPRPPRRRFRRALKIAAGLLLLCVLVPALYLGGITVVSIFRWSAFEKQLAQGIAAQGARDGARTPIGGGGEKGNAWDEYALFIPGLDPRHGYKNPFPVRPDGSPAGPRADGALEIAGELMDRIANAARRERAVRVIDWEQGTDGILDDGRPLRNTAELLLADAWRKRIAGDFDGALGRCEAVMQLVLDASRVLALYALMSIHILEPACEMMSDLAVDPGATKEQLLRIEAILESAEAQLPGPEEAFEAERWHGGARLKLIVENRLPVETPDYAEKEVRWKSVLRRGFSIKGAAVDVARHQEQAVALARRTRPLPWSEAGRMWSTFENDWEAHGNPLQHSLWLGYHYYCWAERGCRARFRLLRIACMTLRKDTSPLPPDPITLKPFESAASARQIVFRTPGPDHWGYSAGAFRKTGDEEQIMITVPLR